MTCRCEGRAFALPPSWASFRSWSSAASTSAAAGAVARPARSRGLPRRRRRTRSRSPSRRCRPRRSSARQPPARRPRTGRLNCTQSLSIVSPARRRGADVEDDLAILDEGDRHPRLDVDLHGEIGREAAVRAPFADGADEIGFGGLLGHRGHILRSARGRSRPRAGAGPATAGRTMARLRVERRGERTANPSPSARTTPGRTTDPRLRLERRGGVNSGSLAFGSG